VARQEGAELYSFAGYNHWFMRRQRAGLHGGFNRPIQRQDQHIRLGWSSFILPTGVRFRLLSGETGGLGHQSSSSAMIREAGGPGEASSSI
jgi:hypothetical protein